MTAFIFVAVGFDVGIAAICLWYRWALNRALADDKRKRAGLS